MWPEAPRRAVVATGLLLALALSPAAAIRAAETDPQKRTEAALMCYCGCANLTVRDCACGTAAGIKSDIAARLSRGQTSEQIVAAYVAERGEQIRSSPVARGFNLVAWITPFAGILAGGIMIVALVRRWRARGAPATPPEAPGAGSAPAPDPADREALERVAREMRETL